MSVNICLLSEFANRLLAGSVFAAVPDGAVWRAKASGVALCGIAGGLFGFATPAAARDWVELAVSRRIAGNQNGAGIERYVVKLEVARLKAVQAGNTALADALGAEMAAAQAVDGVEPLCDGGGAANGILITIDGGGA